MPTWTWAARPTTCVCSTPWPAACTQPPSSAPTELYSSSKSSTATGGKLEGTVLYCFLSSYAQISRNRYNVDCAASESYYGLAEDAFGSQVDGSQVGGGGSCPNVNPLSDAECSGVVSNCWSPGQGDTDCPNFGLCCFDGCANRCVDGPQGR